MPSRVAVGSLSKNTTSKLCFSALQVFRVPLCETLEWLRRRKKKDPKEKQILDLGQTTPFKGNKTFPFSSFSFSFFVASDQLTTNALSNKAAVSRHLHTSCQLLFSVPLSPSGASCSSSSSCRYSYQQHDFCTFPAFSFFSPNLPPFFPLSLSSCP